MKEVKKCVYILMLLMILSSQNVSLAVENCIDPEETNLYDDVVSEFINRYATEEKNVVLLDEEGKTLCEAHIDGNIISYKYKEENFQAIQPF